MLTQIEIENYKSYQKQTLHLAPLTLMIGANASGKSNALEAFRFLSWFSRGERLSLLEDRVNDSEQIIRGQIEDLGHAGANTFKLGCKTDDNPWNHFEVELELREDELHIRQETIMSEDIKFPLYRIEYPAEGLKNEVWVAYNNFARGGKKPQVSCIDQMAIMQQLMSAARFKSGHRRAQKEIPEVTARFQQLLENTLFLDPVPALMRDESSPSNRLRGDGRNLAGVLRNLWEDHGNRPVIIDFIKSLPEQDVEQIKFFKNKHNKQASFRLVESFGGVSKSWSAELLSDGTLRVLAIAVALLSAREGSTLVIEEVDNGVHPSRAKQLLASMLEHAERRSLRLLLTTHNPALMDAVPDSALGDVVFCYRCPSSGTSQLVRLADLQDYSGLVMRGPLGGLVTDGVVDRFVKSPITPEKKKQNAMDWLADLQEDT